MAIPGLLFYHLHRRRKLHRDNPDTVKINGDKAVTAEIINQTRLRDMEEQLADAFGKYTGQTVTVFVNGGGASGLGFTGVLLYTDKVCLTLLSVMGPAPACTLYDPCGAAGNALLSDGFRGVGTVGAITHIRINKIAAFVHNSIGIPL